MEQWAASDLYQEHNVQFLCVCVDSFQVAMAFHKMFKLTKSRNTWIPQRNFMPNYGQLGCGGFIIIAADGKVVSKKTKAFTKFGPEIAFADVESHIMTALNLNQSNLNQSQPQNRDQTYVVGGLVQISDFDSEPALNGQVGTILGYHQRQYLVSISSSQRKIKVPPCCLAPFVAPSTNTVQEQPETEKLLQIEKPNLIGNATVDDEHEQCTEAINALLKATPAKDSAALFTKVVACLQEHFSHEEALIAASENLGSTGSSETRAFSVLAGHAADHQRILATAKDAEKVVLARGFASFEEAQSLALAFENHAQQYDALLENILKSQ